MTTLQLEREPTATRVAIQDDRLIVELADERTLTVPISWYPRLNHATDAERQNWQLLGGGYAIEWADVDEHIGVDGLLAGRRSGESEISLARWMKSRADGASDHL
jgi:hypothetical protein